MSFAAPLALLGLIALPLLGGWYFVEQRRRARSVQAFVRGPMIRSVMPRSPRWRRHVPYALIALALALLVAALARPQRSVARAVKGATVMLANDTSSSMASTDVRPSRLGAAKQAAASFIQALPGSVEVGSLRFAREPTLLQTPTTDHQLTQQVISELNSSGGHTAIGNAIQSALAALKAAPKVAGKRPPGAVVLISDGGSDAGVDPLTAAQQAKQQGVRIYTISVGTAAGTIKVKQGGRTINKPVPVQPQALRQMAAATGGHAYRAANAATVRAIYSGLAAKIGETHVNKQLMMAVAAGGLVLLAFGATSSLFWFARVA